MSRNKTNPKNVFGSFSFSLTMHASRDSIIHAPELLLSLHFWSLPPAVTNLSDYEGDLSFMDDEEIDEITFTNSNQNRRSLTGTSITSMSEDRRSISTLNQQNFDEIVQDDEGAFHFKEEFFDFKEELFE